MIKSVKLLCIFNSHHVLNILYHTNGGGVASRIGTNVTGFGVADVVTALTVLNLCSHFKDRRRKRLNVFYARFKQMQHQPESRFTADTRQTAKFRHGFF